jgi:hypothetical protein
MRLIRLRRHFAQERVELIDGRLDRDLDLAVLARIAAEALILQDEAEAVLAAVSRREHLGIVAPRGGPLVYRFFALRDWLRDERSAGRSQLQVTRLADMLDTILYHHAMQVATALDFLVVEWRSPEMAQQVAAINGLGAPAELLEVVYHDLRDLKTQVSSSPKHPVNPLD